MKKLFAALILLAIGIWVQPALAVDRTATWIDNSSNEGFFTFQSCPGDCRTAGTWTTLQTLPANSKSYTVTGVPTNSTTSYRVGAGNTVGTSWSNIVVDVIPEVAPAPPTFNLPPCATLTEIAGAPGTYRCN